MQQRQSTPDVLSATVPAELAGQRLDRVLGRLFADFSRTRLQRWVRDGRVRVDGVTCVDTRAALDGGERLQVEPAADPVETWPAEARALEVVHDDRHLLVLDKPAGLVVHPGAGNPAGTLVNALVHLDPGLAALPRAGLVHRLDKNTTGLMLVARTLEAHTRLTRMIAAREVSRGYEAVVHGHPPAAGVIDAPLGRHPRQRTRMAVREGGRRAVTHHRTLARYRAHARLAVRLETGRTHQIRVHLAHLGHPIVGDRDYGGVRPPGAATSTGAAEALRGFARQALHACRLSLAHPIHGGALTFESPLPADLAGLVAALEADAAR